MFAPIIAPKASNDNLAPPGQYGVGAITALLVAIIGIDQASKFWVVSILRLPERFHIEISSFFDLTMVYNRGVSFGALTADSPLGRWGLVALSAVIALIFLSWMVKAERRLQFWGLGLVVGGAIGNMIDRIRLGAVADFLDFSGLYFPYVFNIADSAISIGAVILAISMLTSPKQEEQAQKETAPESAPENAPETTPTSGDSAGTAAQDD